MAKVIVAPPSQDVGMREGLMLVQVKDMGKKDWFGWYGGKRVRAGEKFYLFTPEHFSSVWMEILKATQEQRNAVGPKHRKAAGAKLPEPEKAGKK